MLRMRSSRRGRSARRRTLYCRWRRHRFASSAVTGTSCRGTRCEESPGVPFYTCEERGNILLARHVDPCDGGLSAGPDDQILRFGEPLLVDVGSVDVCAAAGEGSCGLPADAGASARHEHDLSVEILSRDDPSHGTLERTYS